MIITYLLTGVVAYVIAEMFSAVHGIYIRQRQCKLCNQSNVYSSRVIFSTTVFHSFSV